MKTIKQTALTYRELICKATGITEQEYENYLFNQAVEYMALNYGQDKIVSDLMQTSHFWQWWINHFNHRNAQLVLKHKISLNVRYEADEKRTMRYDFFDTHNAQKLFVRPSKVVLEASYAEMIGQVFDKFNRNKYATETKTVTAYASLAKGA